MRTEAHDFHHLGLLCSLASKSGIYPDKRQMYHWIVLIAPRQGIERFPVTPHLVVAIAFLSPVSLRVQGIEAPPLLGEFDTFVWVSRQSPDIRQRQANESIVGLQRDRAGPVGLGRI